MTTQGIKVRDIIRYAPKYFIFDVIIWIVAHNIPLASAFYTKLYFDDIGQKSNINITLAIILLLCIRIVFIKIGARIDIHAKQKWAQYLYKKAFESIESRKLDDSLDSGLLIEAINIDVTTIVGTVSYSIDTICNIIYGILAIGILISIDLKLTLLILLLPILAIALNYVLKGKVLKFSQSKKSIGNIFSSRLNSILNESRNIRVSHREKELKSEFQNILNEQSIHGWRYSAWRGLLNNTTNMITELNLFIILLWFVLRSSSNELKAGDIVLFITYSFDIAGMIQYISNLIATFTQCKVYLKDFNNKFEIPVVINAEKSMDSIKIRKQIVPRTINILIGPNGSGKSKLLKDLYITMDKSVLLPDNRSLLNQSILENIKLGRKNSTLSSAMEYSQLTEREFTNGFDQKVDVGGTNISGGQLFRVALARTIYHSEETILIDDNFTSIDPFMRDKLFKNLLKLDKTIVFVDQQKREYYKNYNCILLEEV